MTGIFDDEELNELGKLAPSTDEEGRATPPAKRLTPKPEGDPFSGGGGHGRVFFQSEVEDAQADQLFNQMMEHVERGPMILNKRIINVSSKDVGDGNRELTLRFNDGSAVLIRGVGLTVEQVR